MTNGQRLIKQTLIAGIFVLLVGGGWHAVFRAASPPPPTPTPDPFAHLAALRVLSTQLLNVSNNDYDLVAKVTNPNTDYGSADVEYSLIFYNTANTLLSPQSGTFYILPGQTKFILASPLKFSEPISRAELAIKDVNWQKLSAVGDASINLVPRSHNYVAVNRNGVFGKVGGSILNNSDFDLGQVDVLVLLYDANDRLLAANHTQIDTFLAKTTRGFELAWFTPFAGAVARVEVIPTTNLFLNSNFLRQYQQPERFQQFY